MWFTLLIQRVTAPKRESSISQASTSCFFALSKSRRPFLIPCTKRQKLFSILTGQIHVVDDVFIWKPASTVGGQNTLRYNSDLFFFRQPVCQHLRFSQINGDICSRQGEIEFDGFNCPVPRCSCQIQNRKAGQSISSRQREKQSWIVTASASGLYAERPACTQGLTA